MNIDAYHEYTIDLINAYNRYQHQWLSESRPAKEYYLRKMARTLARTLNNRAIRMRSFQYKLHPTDQKIFDDHIAQIQKIITFMSGS